MALSVIRDPAFEKCLEDLRAEGGNSAALAKKADEIIGKILSFGGTNPTAVRKATRWGEHRIRRCVKYDLGCGYRMVSVRSGSLVVFLYVGTHDECARWIRNNKGIEYDADGGDEASVTRPDRPASGESPEREAVREIRRWSEEYEDGLMKKIDDETLRRVFSGLCGQGA